MKIRFEFRDGALYSPALPTRYVSPGRYLDADTYLRRRYSDADMYLRRRRSTNGSPGRSPTRTGISVADTYLPRRRSTGGRGSRGPTRSSCLLRLRDRRRRGCTCVGGVDSPGRQTLRGGCSVGKETSRRQIRPRRSFRQGSVSSACGGVLSAALQIPRSDLLSTAGSSRAIRPLRQRATRGTQTVLIIWRRYRGQRRRP